jgi:hypothetical protein
MATLFYTLCILLAGFFSGAEKKYTFAPEVVLVASTPGDSLIKSLLTLPLDKKVDFIRWDLHLNPGGADLKSFVLHINYGEGQPNTLGFISGGEKRTFKGAYTVAKSKNGEIYSLKSDKPEATISFLKLNNNIFHLLTPDQKLMVGNGGWSYTLNRKEPLAHTSAGAPALTPASTLLKDRRQSVIYDGRTPCLDFAQIYNLQVSNDCLKLKWRLTLQRDPTTFLPTTYTLNYTLSRRNIIQGKWAVKKGVANNPDALVYQLDPDKADASIFLLAGDENVLFFLDKNKRLLTGDINFSYTLNKKQ